MVKYIFITEGGRDVGLGHLYRMSGLIDALKKDEYILLADVDDLGESVIQTYNYKKIIKERIIRDAYSLLGGNVCVIIDSYSYSEQECSYLNSVNKRLIFMDDSFRINYPQGATVINYNAYAPDKLIVKYDSSCYLGANFFPLRKGFKEHTYSPSKNGIENILVMLGGSDSQDKSSNVGYYLASYFPQKQVHVVAPNSTYDLRNLHHYTGLDATNMGKLMAKCDIAIVTASTIAYELAYYGVPMILFGVRGNQRMNYEYFIANNLAFGAGRISAPHVFRMMMDRIAILEDPVKRSFITQKLCGLVDGRGVERLLAVIRGK